MKHITLTPQRCKQARKLLGWTQQELANKAGLPKITIGKFEAKEETGRLMPLYNDHIVKVLTAGGVSFNPRGVPKHG